MTQKAQSYNVPFKYHIWWGYTKDNFLGNLARVINIHLVDRRMSKPFQGLEKTLAQAL
jgi:hypothetical protein